MVTPNIIFPVLRPLLPPVEEVLPYLKTMDQARWYTNYGPLLRSFESRLADHFGAAPSELATATNATLAIAQCLRALGASAGSLCVMPSWTFIATAAAAVWAGLEPFFIDVDPATWIISPETVLRETAGRQVGAVIVVSAFGAPLNIDEWHAFSRSSGIPVVIDAAAGFDSFNAKRNFPASLPIVISLHATKVFGIGEGAAVITNNSELAKKINAFGNFGFHGSRDATVQGVNAKMPEYAAATGLAHFDRWAETRKCWDDLTRAFVEEVRARPQLQLAPGFGEGWVSSFGLVELPSSVTATEVADELAKNGIETRKWWGEGCHRQTAYQTFGHTLLPCTEYLGRQVLGLPFWLGLSRTDVSFIFKELDEAMACFDHDERLLLPNQFERSQSL